MRNQSLFFGALLVLGLSAALAQQSPVDEDDPAGYAAPGMGYGMGPGMMGYGMGPGGMMGMHPGMGYGMGPGMMGYGMGPGMMGYGMGPGGMMGMHPGMGYGMGPGMMGGYGRGMYGPGMMGGPWNLNLTDKQQQAINDILNKQRQRQFQAMSQIAEQYAQLRQLYAGGRVDENAVSEIYDRIFTIRREMVRNRAQTHNQIYDQLTDAQRQQLRQQGWGRLGW